MTYCRIAKAFLVSFGFCTLLGADEADGAGPIINWNEHMLHQVEVLRNSSFEFSSVNNVNPDPAIWDTLSDEEKSHSHQSDFNSRDERYRRQFSIFGDRARWLSAAEPQTIADSLSKKFSLEKQSEIVLIPGRRDKLDWFANMKVASGLIDDDDSLPDESTIEIGLGLRIIGRRTWISAADLKDAKIVHEDGHSVSVTLIDPITNLSSDLDLDKDHGFAVKSCHLAILNKPADEGAQIECSDFKLMGGIYIPTTMTYTVSIRDFSQKLRIWRSQALHIETCKIGPLENTSAMYLLKWPAKSFFVDSRTHESFQTGETSRTFSDADLAAELNRRATSKE